MKTSLATPNGASLAVGATTEAKNQLESFGRMAFGGAGMLVSDPLSLKMYNLWDDCFEKFRHIFGGALPAVPPFRGSDPAADAGLRR